MKSFLERALREKVKKEKFKRFEFKYKILKKIIQDKKVSKTKKYYVAANFFKRRKGSIGNHRLICFFRGRRRGVWKYNSLSRHAINKLNLEAKLSPVSLKSW